MYKIKEAIVVEGTYDEIRLSGFADTVIIKTNGFSIFNDRKKLETLKTLAKNGGIVILTDSDSAGFKIRNYIKQYITDGDVKNAYIPDIHGKEKRKDHASKEGLLGVEGVSEEIIMKSLKDAGCVIDGEVNEVKNQKAITKTDLYLLGLSGGLNSQEKRRRLCEQIGVPAKISSNMLVGILNRLMNLEQLEKIADEN